MLTPSTTSLSQTHEQQARYWSRGRLSSHESVLAQICHLYTREKILKAVRENQVVMIAGETGCGKTTQVPQYLLEEAWSEISACHSARVIHVSGGIGMVAQWSQYKLDQDKAETGIVLQNWSASQ